MAFCNHKKELMSILDQPSARILLDPRSMSSLLESFPDHVAAAARMSEWISLPATGDIRSILITGLGGSAIGGDFVRAIAEPQLKCPVIVNRDYDLPAFVSASTVVFACSYSGNTEETLSAYQQAKSAGAQLICITSGGSLETMAERDGYPVLHLPSGLPPRAALGYSLITLLGGMQRMGIISDMTESIRESSELLKRLGDLYGTANPESSNPAKQLARSFSGKVVAVYGSRGIMETAAYRWRSQIAENAKNLAFHHALPEMNHNELVGWRFPEHVLRQIGVVLLRDKRDHPKIKIRFDLTRDLIHERAGSLHEVWSEGDSLLARVLSVTFLGDFVSLYLAYLNGIDPTPVEVIDYLKKSLSPEE
jgi:glucose/mannose-6-phosphate isomerase